MPTPAKYRRSFLRVVRRGLQRGFRTSGGLTRYDVAGANTLTRRTFIGGRVVRATRRRFGL